MIVQHGATLRSRGAGLYQAYHLGRAPDHELNNIVEIGYIPDLQNIVQHGATLRSTGAGLYRAHRLDRPPGHELSNILETWYIPNHKMVVQDEAALRRAGAGLYRAHRLGKAPGHELNNIWEIRYMRRLSMAAKMAAKRFDESGLGTPFRVVSQVWSKAQVQSCANFSNVLLVLCLVTVTCQQTDASPEAPILKSIVSDIATIQENTIKSVDEEKEIYDTKLCLYTNGATVHVVISNRNIKNGNKLGIIDLSSAVEKQSIVITPPIPVKVNEYKLVKLEPGKNKEIEKTSQYDASVLSIDASDIDKASDTDSWDIQFSVRDVGWSASHFVEISEDGNNITFLTTIYVKNSSGIRFRNAKLQFLEREFPTESNSNVKSAALNQWPAVTYRGEEKSDLLDGQEKMLVWSSAKRIAISSSSGLFVGGQYLNKMSGTAHPDVANEISFQNTKEFGLGKPLPGGKVSVYRNHDGFISLIGFSHMNAVRDGDEVTIKMPPSVHMHNCDRTCSNTELEYMSLDVHLTQETYKILNQSVAEADYKLTITNLKAAPTMLKITINRSEVNKYTISRTDIANEVNKNGEAFWMIEIPPNCTRELRYRLAIRRT
jgi:hypothetical protein